MVLKIHKYDYCIICSLSVYSNYCVLFGWTHSVFNYERFLSCCIERNNVPVLLEETSAFVASYMRNVLFLLQESSVFVAPF